MTTYSSADEHVLLGIRKTIIIAIASDDVLMERLVLKGGNALDIIYQLSDRSSLDLDFSMANDVGSAEELEDFRHRLFRALHDRFDSLGYVVFDEKLVERPLPKPGAESGAGVTLWGGYHAEFKLISRTTDKQLRDDAVTRLRKKRVRRALTKAEVMDARRRQSQVTGAGSERVFTIEISKFEYTNGRVITKVDEFDCYVYTPAMIAAEKLRAICQQLPEYAARKKSSPRPRDFFDIHAVAEGTNCDLASADHHDLIRNMFAVKEVPLEFMDLIARDSVREFHRQQWDSVRNAVRGQTPSFDLCFDFVVTLAERIRKAMKLGANPIP